MYDLKSLSKANITIRGNHLPTLQTKLKIGQAGDKYERQADAMADRILSMPQNDRTIQRTCSGCEEEELQMKPFKGQAIQMQPVEEEEEMIQTKIRMQPIEEEEELLQTKSQTSSEPEPWESNKIHQKMDAGNPLQDSTKSFMENRFGQSFDSVRIHKDNDSAQMNNSLGAKAFTTGNNIFFNQNEYNPGSTEGKKLLAHELTHVVQQRQVSTSTTDQKSIMREVRGMVTRIREGRQLNDEEWVLVSNVITDAISIVNTTVDSLSSPFHNLIFTSADPRAYTPRQRLVARLFRVHYKNPRAIDALEAHEYYGYILSALQSLGRNSFRVVGAQQANDDPGRDTFGYVLGRDPTIYLSEIFFNDLVEIEHGEGSVTVGPQLLTREQKARVMIHETAHFRLGVAHSGGVFGLDIVNCERGFAIRNANQGLQNAYVYDHFAYCVSRLGE